MNHTWISISSFFLVSIASSIAAGFLLPSSHVCVSRLASPRPFSLQSHASLQLCAVHTCGAVDQGFTWRLGALDQYRSFNGFRAYVSFVHMYCKELWTRHYWPNTCDIIQHFVVMNCGEYSCCMQFCRNDSYPLRWTITRCTVILIHLRNLLWSVTLFLGFYIPEMHL